MRTIGLLIITVVLAIHQAGAAPTVPEFIRKAGQYSLDAQGSTLTIRKEPTGSWSLKVMWRSGDATSSVEPVDSILADDWFVFVEKPTRVWVFDGVDKGLLLSTAEKETGSKSFPGAALAKCPQKFWDALPQKVRAKYRKIEPAGAANGGPRVGLLVGA